MEHARTWLPRGLAIAAFWLYVLAAPPGLYWLDSGELLAAAVRLGSPHPTGFPLFCVLAKIATLMPIGELAFRVNLLSAGCAALAVLWLTRLIIAACRDDLAALIGAVSAGATLAISLVFFRQATVVEVYAPTGMLLSGSLFLVYRVARGGDARYGLALALVAGLGLAGHISYALLGPVIAALFCYRLYRGARWPLCAPLLLCLAAGGLITYLPVRSATGRIDTVDWGHPRTAGALWDHVSAGRIRDTFADEMDATAPEILGDRGERLSATIADSLGPVALLSALFGLIGLIRQRRSRWLAAAAIALIAGDFWYSLRINPMGLVDLQLLVPLSVGVALAAGAGLAMFIRYLGRVGAYAGTVCGLIMVLPPALISIAEIWPASTDDLPRHVSERALEQAAPEGIVLVQSDSLAAGTMYLSEAEGARPDVAVLVRQMLSDTIRTRAVLARAGALSPDSDASKDMKHLSARPMDALIASGRPIVWEIGRDSPPSGAELMAGAPLAYLTWPEPGHDAAPAAHAPGGELADDARAAVADFTELYDSPAHRDRAALRELANSLVGLGRLVLGRGDADSAERLFAAATAVRPEHVAAWVNWGTVAAARGDMTAALAHTERALGLAPNHLVALLNAARYAIRKDEDARGRAYLDRAMAITQTSPTAWALSALLDLRAGKPESAQEHLKRALALDPANSDALDLVRQLRRASERKPSSP